MNWLAVKAEQEGRRYRDPRWGTRAPEKEFYELIQEAQEAKKRGDADKKISGGNQKSQGGVN